MPAVPARDTPPPPEPLCTRVGRAQALLRLPDAILLRLTETAPLAGALDAFRRKRVRGDTAFDVVAFVHAFGVCGPRPHDWHALFARAGALRAEDVAVLVGFVACGGKGERATLINVLLGTDAAPGILDKVCQLWDEWLVSDASLRTAVGDRVEGVAAGWRVVKTRRGFVWKCGDGNEEGMMSEHALGDAVEVCGMKVVEGVMRGVVDEVSGRASFGGRDQAMEMLAARAGSVVEGALRQAKAVLVNRVFECVARDGGCIYE